MAANTEEKDPNAWENGTVSEAFTSGRIDGARVNDIFLDENGQRNDASQQQQILSDPREIAARQADQVLESLQGGDFYLDGFNLLQVIANPRGNPQDLTFSSGRYGSHQLGVGSQSRHGHSRHGSRSSFHGRAGSMGSMQAYSSAQQAAATRDDVGTGSADIIQETYLQLESTLVHVTEQLEALNQTLEEWSRKILEEDPYASHADELPEAQLRELPVVLQTTPSAMNELQSYLGSSGMLAHKFRELQGMHEQLEQSRLRQHHYNGKTVSEQDGCGSSPYPPSKNSSSLTAAESVALLREEIPNAFWHNIDELDLTRPDTFQTLFFAKKLDLDAMAIQAKSTKGYDKEETMYDWFPLVPPDSLNPWLDKVEIALLEAVREQSHAFFEESIRFATLQEWIESLLEQVISMQTLVDSLLSDSVRPMLTVPADHAEKQEWQSVVDLLDSANELIRCKASIAGYLAAADDLTALDQVYYGRQKLKQSNLTQLRALQGVAKQLDQYENLIVTNLREELVEAFLDWNNSSLSSAMATSPTMTSTYALPKGTSSSSAPSFNVGAAHSSRVRDIVIALAKCHGLRKTVQAYNTRLQDVMRLTVRTVVAEFADGATSGAASMTFGRFLDCLDMTMEQLYALVTSTAAVDAFCVKEGLMFQDEEDGGAEKNGELAEARTAGTPMAAVMTGAAELSCKSISELLRLRKEAHSLLSLDEMKRMWDKCVTFATNVEDLTGHKASVLRSTLLAQAKAFVERKHDSNMGALVAALDSERWTQCDVSTERQAALTRLCTGRTLIPRSQDEDETLALEEKEQEVEVNGVRYKVVWSCLLLVEMIIGNLSAASHFTGSTSSIVGKVADLLRLFNSRTTQLVLGAKAIHSAARLKSINAKHLSLVTQCLGMVISILPNIRASLMAQLPSKQHRLLNDIDQIKKEYADHNEKVLNKFVTIIGGIIEHHLAPKLPGTDFDTRARDLPPDDSGSVLCCVFLEGISSNTTKMHHVLHSLLPPEHLQDVFSRIFAYVDHKIPTLFVSATHSQAGNQMISEKRVAAFRLPQTQEGKQRMLRESEALTQKLNGLEGVQPWDFTLVDILERTLEFNSDGNAQPEGHMDSPEHDSEAETEGTTLPSDTEDPLTDIINPSDEAPCAGSSSLADTKSGTNALVEDPDREANESTVVQDFGVIISAGSDANGSEVRPPDYPAEITTL